MGMHRYMNDDYSGWIGTPTKEELMTQENKPQHTAIEIERGANGEFWVLKQVGVLVEFGNSVGSIRSLDEAEFAAKAWNSYYDLKRRAELVKDLTEMAAEMFEMFAGDCEPEDQIRWKELIAQAEALEGE